MYCCPISFSKFDLLIILHINKFIRDFLFALAMVSTLLPIHAEGSGRAANEGQYARGNNTYFDQLPMDAVLNVVRFLSRTPRLPDWKSRLEVSTVLLLNGLEGQISSAPANLHETLCIHKFRSNDVHNYGRKNMIITDSFQSFKELVPLTGTQYSSLDIRTDFEDGPNLAKFVTEHCTNIERLAFFRSNPSCWLESFGEKIRYIRLYEHVPLLDVQVNCPFLRELQIDALNSEKTTEGKLWETIGDTLEFLRIRELKYGNETIMRIEKYCRKLTSVHIEKMEDCETIYLECLRSFGSQLEFASIPDISKVDLKDTVKSCAKARFKLFPCHVDLGRTLNVLGDQLEDVMCLNYDRLLSDSEIEWAPSRNLLWVQLKLCNEKHIRAFLESPKRLLRDFDLFLANDHYKRTNLEDIMDLIADNTGALEKFTLTTELPQALHSSAFASLIKRNVLLSQVRILTRGPKPRVLLRDRMAEITVILESFLKIPNLDQLILNDREHGGVERSEQIEKICNSYRYRNRKVHVMVFGIDYLK